MLLPLRAFQVHDGMHCEVQDGCGQGSVDLALPGAVGRGVAGKREGNLGAPGIHREPGLAEVRRVRHTPTLFGDHRVSSAIPPPTHTQTDRQTQTQTQV